ncbi:hypothetical protein CLF_108134 [Clonorchis sinensis]|uniref:Uncharacterized protein n=1 Tax=Clonorchis sinensis TaxID=79923 RepID=G7YHN6_CLOSI|nr:hypothetical protein CLF_108134 [Clonorchis sinensis]
MPNGFVTTSSFGCPAVAQCCTGILCFERPKRTTKRASGCLDSCFELGRRPSQKDVEHDIVDFGYVICGHCDCCIGYGLQSFRTVGYVERFATRLGFVTPPMRPELAGSRLFMWTTMLLYVKVHTSLHASYASLKRVCANQAPSVMNTGKHRREKQAHSFSCSHKSESYVPVRNVFSEEALKEVQVGLRQRKL